MPLAGIAHRGLHPVQGVPRVLPLPKRGVVYVKRGSLLEFLPAPLRVIGRRRLRLLQPPALPPGPGAPLVLPDVAHQALHAPVVHVQILAPGQPDPLPVHAPQLLQHVPGQPLRVLDDGVVVVPAADGTILAHGGVFRCGHPLGPLHSVAVAPAVQPLDEVGEVQVRPPVVPRHRQVVVVIRPRPGEVPLPEVGIHQLHVVAFGPLVVVGLLGQGGGLLLLGPAARLVFLRGDRVQVHFHVRRRVVVFSADMLLFPVKQTHDRTPAPAPGLVP